MKAFLLAAGHGTRLWPVTRDIPKCLVPVRGAPILQIWLDICRDSGVDELLVNVHAHADQVRDFVALHATGLKVTVSEETQLLGSAGTLRAHREWAAGEKEFLVLYCDVLTTADLSAMLSFHRSHGSLATLGVYPVEDPRRCGIVRTDGDGRIVSFVEKPKHPTSKLAFSGIVVAKPEVLDLIPSDLPAPDIAYDVLPRLVGRMHAYPIREFIIDIGTHETYARAQREWPGRLSVRATKNTLSRVA